jgi:hypothetical protein
VRDGGLAGGEHRTGIPEHRVVAVLEPGGAGVVRLPGEVKPPPTMGPDVAADGDGVVEVDQTAALFDVELDEAADPAQGVVVATDAVRVATRGRERLGHRRAVGISEAARTTGGHGTGDDAGPGAGDTEPGALLIDEVDHADGPTGFETLVPQRIDGRERADHAERSVEGTTVRDAVEVGPGHDTLVTLGRG